MLIDLDGRRDLLRCGIEPGASPFKIKGMAYRGHLDYVARKIDGGLEAFAGATESEDPKLRAFFFDQNFVPSAFYDILPLVIAGIICGKMTGKRFLDFVHERALFQAELDVGGFYRFLLKLVTAKLVALYLPRVQAQYFDFGSCESRASEPNLVVGAFRGIPAMVAPWLEVVLQAYTKFVMDHASKYPAEFRSKPLVAEDPIDGIAIATIPFEIAFNIGRDAATNEPLDANELKGQQPPEESHPQA